MLSRDEMRQVERSLANHEQDTRDEIGFLLIHQGFTTINVHGNGDLKLVTKPITLAKYRCNVRFAHQNRSSPART
jgi:hypothetical protein